MPSEIDELLVKLSSMKISTSYTDYTKLVESTDKYNDKFKIFMLIEKNNDTLPSTLSLLYTFTSKLEQGDDALFTHILNFMCNLRNTSMEESEWVLKILFLMLERVKKRDEYYLKILETLRRHFVAQSIISHLINLMYTSNTSDIVFEILNFLPELCGEFVRVVILQKSVTVLKNMASVLPMLINTQASQLNNVKVFEVFMESEHVFLRICFLEMVFNLCKQSKSADINNTAVNCLIERLSDQHYAVRAKSISLLSTMLEEGAIESMLKKQVLLGITCRIKDKAVIVRKRAIGTCCKMMTKHPFIHSENLQKVDLATIKHNELLIDSSRAVTSSIKMVDYYKELNDFHDIVAAALVNVVEVFNADVKSDILDCIEFIKLAYFFKIEGAKQALEKLFDLIWSQNTGVIYDSIRDLLIRIRIKHKQSPNKQTYSFLKEFITVKPNFSFNKILREVSRRKYLDKNFNIDLCVMFNEKVDPFEISYVLSCTTQHNPVLPEQYLGLLETVTSILFSSGNADDLKSNLMTYKNVLRIKLKKPMKRDIEKLVMKNLAKMNFFDYQVIDLTVALLYRICNNVESSCSDFLDLISTRNSNLLKLIQAVGTIALRHYKYVENLEKLIRNRKVDVNVGHLNVPNDIREKRKSIDASRMSVTAKLEESVAENDENRDLLASNESLRNTNDSLIGDNSMIDASKLNVHLSEKTEDEIADFFFYVKEREMLFGENSLLAPFKDIVVENCDSKDESLQNVSYIALFKLMCISSEFFQQNYPLFIMAFNHENYKIRANAVVTMSDFLLSYNTFVEQDTHLLFDMLSDSSVVVKKNALLTVYNLLQKNILKVKGYSVKLTALLLDPDLQVEVRDLLKSLSDRDNIISIIFYEAVTSKNTCEVEVVGFLCNLVSEKAREALFIKILKAKVDVETVKLIFDKFCFDDKFVQEISHYEEYKKAFF